MPHTNADRFKDRHLSLISRADYLFAERQKRDPSVTIESAVAEYATAVRLAITKRDCIAACYAVCAAHLVARERAAKRAGRSRRETAP
jgi:hypothetical protein